MTKTEKPPENAIVAKDNSLIEKMSKFKLSELRLIAFCLAHYDSRAEENPSITARVADLADIFPMNEKSAYAVVRQAMLGINQKPLEFKEGKEHHFWNWFSGFSYIEGEGTFKFRINRDVKPYLLDLEGVFSAYRLGEVKFRSGVAWLLFENLNKWKTTRKWTVELDEIKALLGVAGKYPRWIDFKKYVLEKSLKEINKHSNLSVTYEKVKHVRSVAGVTFFIDQKQPEDTITVADPREQIHRLLLDAGLNNTSTQDLLNLIERAGKIDEYLKKIPKIIARHTPQKGPKAKYVRGAINNELNQMTLFDLDEPAQDEPEHKVALDCWNAKRQTGEQCKVRKRGAAGNRKKCKICLEKIPVDVFGC